MFCGCCCKSTIYTLLPRPNSQHFASHNLKLFFLYKNCCVIIHIVLKSECCSQESNNNLGNYSMNSSIQFNPMFFHPHMIQNKSYREAMVLCGRQAQKLHMMTSSNGNIFRVTAICAGNSPVPGDFPAQRPVTRSFDNVFDLRLNTRLNKQSWGWWFETLLRPLWRHHNAYLYTC